MSVWSHKYDIEKYKVKKWNDHVDSLTDQDIKLLHLDSKLDLELTRFSKRTDCDFSKAKNQINQIDEYASKLLHDTDPIQIASMIKRTTDTRYHALFRCAFKGESHLDDKFNFLDDVLVEEPKQKRQKKPEHR